MGSCDNEYELNGKAKLWLCDNSSKITYIIVCCLFVDD